MRKLIVVLFLFLLSIICLILIFNTVTTLSIQTNIKVATDLPIYQNSNIRLSQALQIPTTPDSSKHTHFNKFHKWITKSYPTLFKNPNVEWQRLNKFSLLAKWVGRSPELNPIVFVAMQHTDEPDLETIPEWSYNPFLGKIENGYIHGQGCSSGKAVMIALLEVLTKFVEQNILPNRTIYLAFPHDNQVGESAIINSLKKIDIKPEFILKTGGLIVNKNDLFNIPKKVALIGIGQQSVVQSTVEIKNKNSNNIIKKEIHHLVSALPPLDTDHPVITQFLSFIIPELNFSQRLVLSNKWLLNNLIQKRLQKNPFTQNLFGNNIATNLINYDTSKSTITSIQFSSPKSLNELEKWLKTHLQHPQIQLLGQTQTLQKTRIAPIQNHAYRIISNTCKEIFPNLITAPTLVKESYSTNWQTKFNSDIYYFHPLIFDQICWKKHLRKVDDKISIKNYKQMLQFYHKLLLNNI
ncbi:MAG: M20/M25/M40 family metallo-hydrolase [Saprospiraceae bacterium]|nr:M20/M25/M40 family metallo-hydrolase [Saprospiraceae bacterium]